MRLSTLCGSWLAILTVLSLSTQVKSVYGHTEYHKKGKKCYQCAWSPPKLAYATVKRPHGKSASGLYYSAKKVPVKVLGGWDKCYDSFSKRQAEEFGIDQWECEHNCYTRTDKNGNLYRGCYKGEFNVNPNKLGCHMQAGSQYCFCVGELCNNKQSPSISSNISPVYETKRSSEDYDPYSFIPKYILKYATFSGKDKYSKYPRKSKNYNSYDKYNELDKFDEHQLKYGYGDSEKKGRYYGLKDKYSYESYEDDKSQEKNYGYGSSEKPTRKTRRMAYKYGGNKHDNDKGYYDKYDYGKRYYRKYGYNKHSVRKHGHAKDYADHDGYSKLKAYHYNYNKDDSLADFDKHDSHDKYNKYDSSEHDYDGHVSSRHKHKKYGYGDYGYDKYGRYSRGKYNKTRHHAHGYDHYDAKYGRKKHREQHYGKYPYGGRRRSSKRHYPKKDYYRDHDYASYPYYDEDKTKKTKE